MGELLFNKYWVSVWDDDNFFFNMDGEEGMCLVPLYGTLNLKIIQMVNLTLFYYNKALLNKF